MDLPLGGWLIGLVGAIVVVYGANEVIKPQGEDDPMVNWAAVPTAIRRICRLASVPAAHHRDARRLPRARCDSAQSARSRRYTRVPPRTGRGRERSWLLAFMAAGLLGYAVDQAVHARYRRIRRSPRT